MHQVYNFIVYAQWFAKLTNEFSAYVWFDVLICFVFLYPNSRKYLYFMSKCRINFLGILDIRIDYIFLVSGYKISMHPSNLITILNFACWACKFLCNQASFFAQKINFARPPATIQYFFKWINILLFCKKPIYVRLCLKPRYLNMVKRAQFCNAVCILQYKKLEMGVCKTFSI